MIRHIKYHYSMEASSPGQSNIELAMGENGLRQEDARLLQGLALRLVDGHAPRQPHWTLPACQNEGELALLRRHWDARDVDA